MSKKQEKSATKGSSNKELFYGNQDKDKKFPIPQHLAERDDVVVVRQTNSIEVAGKNHDIDHEAPIQVYSQTEFDKLSAENGAGFKAMGVKVHVLHGEVDEDEVDAIEDQNDEILKKNLITTDPVTPPVNK